MFGLGCSNGDRDVHKKTSSDLVSGVRLGFAKPEDMLNGSIFFEALTPEMEQKYRELLNEVQAGG